ncbi:hypothetical protein L1887_34593 [Cichorium endivia]|nr:hypothetical protein L1887_34593 [Cichorium endivia]
MSPPSLSSSPPSLLPDFFLGLTNLQSFSISSICRLREGCGVRRWSQIITAPVSSSLFPGSDIVPSLSLLVGVLSNGGVPQFVEFVEMLLYFNPESLDGGGLQAFVGGICRQDGQRQTCRAAWIERLKEGTLKIIQILRFKHGQIYSAVVSVFLGGNKPSRVGNAHGDISVNFSCDPDVALGVALALGCINVLTMLYDLGTGLEIFSPLCPQLFLETTSVGNFTKGNLNALIAKGEAILVVFNVLKESALLFLI